MWFDPKQSSNRILVIDDNLDIHHDFKVILASQSDEGAPLDDLESDLFGAPDQAADRPENNRWTDYDLAFAAQGQEGFAMAREAMAAGKPFALAFVDMRMPPGWNGLETIERLWEVDRDLQVVICTAYSDFSQLEIMQRLGRSDNLLILKKPFDPEEIAQVTVTMLQKREMTRRAALTLEQMERLVAERTEAMARSQFHEGRTRQAMDNLLNNLDGEDNRFVRTEKLATLGMMLSSFTSQENDLASQLHEEITLLEGFVRTLGRNLDAFHNLADELHAGREAGEALSEAEAVTHRADLAGTLQDTRLALERLKDKAGAMEHCLQGIREFARQEAAVADYTDLNRDLNLVLDLVRSYLAPDVELESELDELPPLVCIRGQILQVVSALLLNAVQASGPRGGRVRVRSWLEDQTVHVAVEDNGCGIDEDNIQRVFDPYFTTKGKHWGTGLGLGVARDVVRQHGGRLRVDSRVGVGTTFTLELPLQANEPGARPGETQIEELLTRVPVD